MRKTLLVGLAAVSMFLGAGVASAAKPFTPAPHHGTSVTAAEWSYIRGLPGGVRIKGNLVVTQPGCFYVKMKHEFWLESPRSETQCGPGTIALHAETASIWWYAHVSICRANNDDCGPSVFIGNRVGS
ncbi:hypothetical protein NLX83_19930 [Allokutzneria sp. A3M-2-11 16]|uniref:hypothetical protein n=1 Tax=Allokutzneria sp. A3M-2-11 16 TaxID=2962043 RepID=UPI0020B7645F|nr:hypothetical protein [Allokutzneria sp. A3M-2-11 16]MCP3801532.1 hypothetical protein [Allokutzneria sp. A3M-2-11 16]